jgi:hypothetical protein
MLGRIGVGQVYGQYAGKRGSSTNSSQGRIERCICSDERDLAEYLSGLGAATEL